MKAVDTHMFREAASAADRVDEQLRLNRTLLVELAARLRSLSPRLVFICARGSSSHAATYAKYLIELWLGIPVVALAPSTSSVYGQPLSGEGAVGLAISQSGASPDILSSVAGMKDAGVFTVALTNSPGSPLAHLADAVLPLHAGNEQSVAATKSYITSLSAIASLVALWRGDRELCERIHALPQGLQQAWQLDWQQAEDVLQGATNMYVVGRGVGLGIAQEAALKFKECCGLHAEGFSAAELMHGPLALVKPGFPVLLFSQRDAALDSLMSVAERCRGQGGRCLLAATDTSAELPVQADHPVLEPILQIQSFYRMLVSLSIARGYDPDQPPHLRKVTETL